MLKWSELTQGFAYFTSFLEAKKCRIFSISPEILLASIKQRGIIGIYLSAKKILMGSLILIAKSCSPGRKHYDTSGSMGKGCIVKFYSTQYIGATCSNKIDQARKFIISKVIASISTSIVLATWIIPLVQFDFALQITRLLRGKLMLKKIGVLDNLTGICSKTERLSSSLSVICFLRLINHGHYRRISVQDRRPIGCDGKLCPAITQAWL